MTMKKWCITSLFAGLWCVQAYGMLYVNTYKIENEQPAIFKKNIEMAIDAGKKIVFDSIKSQALALQKMQENKKIFDSYFLRKFQGAGGLVGFDWLQNALRGVETLSVAQRPVFEEKIKKALQKIIRGAKVDDARQDFGVIGGVPGGQGGGVLGGVPGGQAGQGEVPGGIPGEVPGDDLVPPQEEGDLAQPPVLEEEAGPVGGEQAQKKPAGPQVLSADELAVLDPQAKAKSDTLFIEKLREISKMLNFSKTWQAQFEESMKRLQEMRKNKDFFGRESFDKLFASIEKPHKDMTLVGPLADLFDKYLVRAKDVEVSAYLGTLKNNFMQGFSAGIGKELADLLKTCLFDPTKFMAIEEDIIRLCTSLVMLTRGVEPDAEKLSKVQQFRSDQAVVELFQRFNAGTGSFAGKVGKDLLKQFAREINLLRITPDFLKYKKLSEKGKGLLAISPLDLLCDAAYGTGEIKQSDFGIFMGILFNPEANKGYLKGEKINKELVIVKVFDLKKSVEDLLKTKTVRDLITQLSTLEKGLAADPARVVVVTGLIKMIRDNADAQNIVDELKKIAGWVGLRLPDEARLVQQLNEGRASQQLQDGVKAAFAAAKKKIVLKPQEDITSLLYEELAKAPGMNKEALQDVFSNSERTLDALKEFFTRTLKLKGLDSSTLVKLNMNIKPLGVILQALTALPGYKGKRLKLEMLHDFIEVLMFPQEKLKNEEVADPVFEPIINNRDEISGGWVFKADFEALKKAVKSKDFVTLEKALSDFVASCGAWAQTKDDQDKWNQTVVQANQIIKTAMQDIAKGIPIAIIKELEKLLQGDSELNGQPIIPELIIQDKGGYDRNKLIIKILDLLKANATLKDLVKLIRDNMLPAKLKVLDTSDMSVVVTKYKAILEEINKAVDPGLFADPLRQQTLDGIKSYFDTVKNLLDQCKGYMQ